ncbi:MAG: hypothetical protein RSD57_09665 [Comamonas sp.]
MLNSPQQLYSVHDTSGCRHYNHPEFRLRVSNNAIPLADVSFLLDYLEKSVERGQRFHSGESLQIGWMYTTLKVGPEGCLHVLEPDMKAIPVEFIDSVDSTLTHLRNQKDVVESLTPAVLPAFPSLRSSVVVHVNYKSATRILLTRFEAADAADSGWWLTDLDDPAHQDPQRFLKTSLYQLGVNRPDLVKFFAIPFGLQVAIDDTYIGVLDSKGELQQRPNSFLSELNKACQP